MRRWLHQQRFRYKKPHAVPAKASHNKQRQFIARYKQWKEKARKQGEPIYFVDSVHPAHQTQLAYGWIQQGKRKAVASTARQYRMNIMGGICLANYRVVSYNASCIDEHSICLFLYRLRQHHPGHYYVHVIWDNAGYHRSRHVKTFAKELGIKIHYLPPYSPNLNPIERLWKVMREQVMYNQYYESFSTFVDAIKQFFRHISKKKKLLRSRINDNFQTLNELNLAS